MPFDQFPSTEPLDVTWLLSTLAVAGRVSPTRADELRDLGVRRVVDLREDNELIEDDVLREAGIQVLHLPTAEGAAVRPGDLWRGVRWVREGMKNGSKVVIRSDEGTGRSALLACCVMVAEGLTAEESISHAKTMRWLVSPSPAQLQMLIRWTEEWHLSHDRPAPAIFWDDLAEIAYRHLRPRVTYERRLDA